VSRPRPALSRVTLQPPLSVDSRPNLALPRSVWSRDGQRVDLRGQIWRIRQAADGGQLFALRWRRYVDDLAPLQLSTAALQSIRIFVAERLERAAGCAVRGDFETILRFLRWYGTHWSRSQPGRAQRIFDWSLVDEGCMRAYLALGLRSPSRGCDFNRVRFFYRWGVRAGLEAFAPAISTALATIRAPGNLKGHHVAGDDVEHGPLSSEEVRGIAEACASDRGLPVDRAMIMLFLEIGFNPNQYVRLTNSDLIRYSGEVGAGPATQPILAYQIAIPRNKKRTARRETVRRPLSQKLGDLLWVLKHGGDGDRLLWWLPADDDAKFVINTQLRRFVKAANLRSPRTGRPLHLFPRRFRYTLATEAAEDGAAPLEIARLLDHTDDQHVRVYVEHRAAQARRMAAATDGAYQPLNARFKGSIVDESSSCDMASVVSGTVIHLPAFPLDVGGVGVCGRDLQRDGLCALYPPLSCYVCPLFMAFRSGLIRPFSTPLQVHLKRWKAQAAIVCRRSWTWCVAP
jgi:integrase